MPQVRIFNNGTDQIQNGPCNLNRIVFGKKGASSNIMTVWDGSNAEPGNIITIIDTVNAPIGEVKFDLPLRNGLKIVTATGTAPDAVVVYNENRN